MSCPPWHQRSSGTWLRSWQLKPAMQPSDRGTSFPTIPRSKRSVRFAILGLIVRSPSVWNANMICWQLFGIVFPWRHQLMHQEQFEDTLRLLRCFHHVSEHNSGSIMEIWSNIFKYESNMNQIKMPQRPQSRFPQPRGHFSIRSGAARVRRHGGRGRGVPPGEAPEGRSSRPWRISTRCGWSEKKRLCMTVFMMCLWCLILNNGWYGCIWCFSNHFLDFLKYSRNCLQ